MMIALVRIPARIAPDAEWAPVYHLSDLPRDGYAVKVVDYLKAGFGRGPREIKWYRRKGRQLVFANARPGQTDPGALEIKRCGNDKRERSQHEGEISLLSKG